MITVDDLTDEMVRALRRSKHGSVQIVHDTAIVLGVSVAHLNEREPTPDDIRAARQRITDAINAAARSEK